MSFDSLIAIDADVSMSVVWEVTVVKDRLCYCVSTVWSAESWLYNGHPVSEYVVSPVSEGDKLGVHDVSSKSYVIGRGPRSVEDLRPEKAWGIEVRDHTAG